MFRADRTDVKGRHAAAILEKGELSTPALGENNRIGRRVEVAAIAKPGRGGPGHWVRFFPGEIPGTGPRGGRPLGSRFPARAGRSTPEVDLGGSICRPDLFQSEVSSPTRSRESKGNRMRTGWTGFALAAWLMATGVSAGADGPNPEDARLEEFFRAYLERSFRAEPTTATGLGDHRFDDQLDDLSPPARAARVDLDRKALADLIAQFDPKTLSRDGRIDREILRRSLENAIWTAERFRPFEDDPRVYGGYITGGVYALFTQSTLPKEVNLKNALARMALVPEGRSRSPGRRSRTRPGSRPRPPSARPRGRSGSTPTTSSQFAGLPKGQGELGERAKAIVEALGAARRSSSRSEVLPRSTEEWRVGREVFVGEARPRAGFGDLGRRGA